MVSAGPERCSRYVVIGFMPVYLPPLSERICTELTPELSAILYDANRAKARKAHAAARNASRRIHGSARTGATSSGSIQYGERSVREPRIRWILSSVWPISARKSPFEAML